LTLIKYNSILNTVSLECVIDSENRTKVGLLYSQFKEFLQKKDCTPVFTQRKFGSFFTQEYSSYVKHRFADGIYYIGFYIKGHQHTKKRETKETLNSGEKRITYNAYMREYYAKHKNKREISENEPLENVSKMKPKELKIWIEAYKNQIDKEFNMPDQWNGRELDKSYVWLKNLLGRISSLYNELCDKDERGYAIELIDIREYLYKPLEEKKEQIEKWMLELQKMQNQNIPKP